MAKILLIEDDELVRELFCEVLETCGHSVIVASDGEEGIAQFDATIELVITDMNMPRRNGLQTACVLRQACPNIPIITMSGHPGQSQELSTFEAQDGINRFLAKPFTPELLSGTITELLTKARPV